VCNAPNKKPLYCVDDDYCLSSNTRTFEADLIAKSKVDQNIFYILSKGIQNLLQCISFYPTVLTDPQYLGKEEGGKTISNGTVSIMRKTVFPDYDCFIFADKPKNEWESTVFLREYLPFPFFPLSLSLSRPLALALSLSLSLHPSSVIIYSLAFR
jgi:hypothetical protein